MNIDDKHKRDLNSKAVLSTDRTALFKHRQQKNMKDDINTLKQEVSELKQLLLQLIETKK